MTSRYFIRGKVEKRSCIIIIKIIDVDRLFVSTKELLVQRKLSLEEVRIYIDLCVNVYNVKFIK